MKLIATVQLVVRLDAKDERSGARILRKIFKPQAIEDCSDHEDHPAVAGCFPYVIVRRAVKVKRRKAKR